MSKALTCTLAFCFALPLMNSNIAFAGPKKSKLIAINVLLTPDSKMGTHAKMMNQVVKENYPNGFAFDDSHTPHITLVQAFVTEADINAVTVAVNKAINEGPKLPIRLEAIGLETSKMGGIGVLSFTIKKSPDLSQLAFVVLKAVKPFAKNGGTKAAFVNTGKEEINDETVKYVAKFLTDKVEDKYSPHLTVGLAKEDFIKKYREEKPFQNFEFEAENVGIYQLGNFGTARKRL